MREKQNFREFRGIVRNVKPVQNPKIKNAASINDMARFALNYLDHNPVKARNWECKFNMYPSHIPYHFIELKPNQYGYDVISLADTDLRMNLVYKLMRELAGIEKSSEAEEGLRKRAESYADEHHVVYANPSALTGLETEGEWLTIWGTAHNVLNYCNNYERTHDLQWLTQAKEALDTILSLKAKGDGMQTYLHGLAGYKDGIWLEGGWLESHSKNYVFIVEPLVRYYELSGDKFYLREAILFAEGIINCMREDREECEINPETGEFGAHVHTHTRTLWGMSHLAYITKDARYLKWARTVFDFVVSKGNDLGWYPEALPQSTARSETCINGDMMAAAYYLSLSGNLDLFDTMERNWRNYLYRAQFKVTPDIETAIRKINSNLPEEKITEAIEQLHDIEGGFSAQTRWNDFAQYTDIEKSIYMMGCCPPSGMLALYFIAKAAAIEKEDGVYINMTATVDTPYAKMVSDYGSDNVLQIEAKKSCPYFIRIPEWSCPSTAHVIVNGTDTNFTWDGPQCRYMKVDNIHSGDLIMVSYALFSFEQEIQVTSVPDCHDVYTMFWVGNTVVSVTPKSDYIDFFSDQRGMY